MTPCLVSETLSLTVCGQLRVCPPATAGSLGSLRVYQADQRPANRQLECSARAGVSEHEVGFRVGFVGSRHGRWCQCMHADQGHAYKAESQTCVTKRGSSSPEFAPLANDLTPSSRLSRRLRASLPAHGRHFCLPRQSTNARRLNSNAPRPNLIRVLRPFRLGSTS